MYKRQGQAAVQIPELCLTPGVVGMRNGNAQLGGKLIRIFLVPRPLHGIPARSRNPKKLFEAVPVTGKCGNCFISSWEQNPTLQPIPLARFDHTLDRIVFVPQVLHPHYPGYVLGEL